MDNGDRRRFDRFVLDRFEREELREKLLFVARSDVILVGDTKGRDRTVHRIGKRRRKMVVHLQMESLERWAPHKA